MSDTVDAAVVTAWLREFARLIAANKENLTALDSAIGDADHGTNMDRGLTAVVKALSAEAGGTPAALLKRTGMTLVSTVGGASGPLYGTFFLRMGTALGATEEVSPEQLVDALTAAKDGVVARGKAELGDKTMYDALAPAVHALAGAVREGSSLSESLAAAEKAAQEGRDATVPLLARKGRASYLGERSVGHQDPGATSTALLMSALREAVTAADG
jgi:phosphoenolpyruvate---glycerone phosphotransferase subunit DhaL